MALAFSINPNSRRDLGETITDVTCDRSYPGSGGYPITGANFGMLNLPDAMDCAFKTGQGIHPVYNQGAAKLQLLKGAAGLLVECAAGDVSSAVVVRCKAKGQPVL
jgi:hypothetical protein